jgi:hypothetical protein
MILAWMAMAMADPPCTATIEGIVDGDVPQGTRCGETCLGPVEATFLGVLPTGVVPVLRVECPTPPSAQSVEAWFMPSDHPHLSDPWERVETSARTKLEVTRQAEGWSGVLRLDRAISGCRAGCAAGIWRVSLGLNPRVELSFAVRGPSEPLDPALLEVTRVRRRATAEGDGDLWLRLYNPTSREVWLPTPGGWVGGCSWTRPDGTGGGTTTATGGQPDWYDEAMASRIPARRARWLKTVCEVEPGVVDIELDMGPIFSFWGTRPHRGPVWSIDDTLHWAGAL